MAIKFNVLCVFMKHWVFGSIWLSQKSFISWWWNSHKEESRLHIHINSLVAIAIALCFASANDQDIVAYFLVYQETGARPRVIKYHVKDFLESGYAAQWKSHNL